MRSLRSHFAQTGAQITVMTTILIGRPFRVEPISR